MPLIDSKVFLKYPKKIISFNINIMLLKSVAIYLCMEYLQEILAAARALKANYNHLSIIPSNISSVQWFNDIEKCHCKDSNDHSHFHCPMCTKWSRPFSTQQKMSKHLQFHQDRCIEFEGMD